MGATYNGLHTVLRRFSTDWPLTWHLVLAFGIWHWFGIENCKRGTLYWLCLPDSTPLALTFCESLCLSLHTSMSVCVPPLRAQLIMFINTQVEEVNTAEPGLMQDAERFFVLTQTDNLWKEHLQAIKFLQQVSARSACLLCVLMCLHAGLLACSCYPVRLS